MGGRQLHFLCWLRYHFYLMFEITRRSWSCNYASWLSEISLQWPQFSSQASRLSISAISGCLQISISYMLSIIGTIPEWCHQICKLLFIQFIKSSFQKKKSIWKKNHLNSLFFTSLHQLFFLPNPRHLSPCWELSWPRWPARLLSAAITPVLSSRLCSWCKGTWW